MPHYISENTDYERPDPIPAGMHVAICYGFFDIGTQTYMHKGKEIKSKKGVIIFEVPEERIEIEIDGELKNLPRAINIEESLSLHIKANLRKILSNWRGRDFTQDELKKFDINSIVGIPALLNVIHKESKTNGNTYHKISGINPMVKGTPIPKQENPSVTFSFTNQEYGNVVFPDGMPEWVRKKAMDSAEYEELMGNQAPETPVENRDAMTSESPVEYDDDVPF